MMYVVRIDCIIYEYPSSSCCVIMFLVRLQGKLEFDHSWK